MDYNKSEQSLLTLAHRVTDRRLARDIRIAWIGATIIWITATSVALGSPLSRESIGFAGMLAGFGGMALGYVMFRTRALMLIQKLLASNATSPLPSSAFATPTTSLE